MKNNIKTIDNLKKLYIILADTFKLFKQIYYSYTENTYSNKLIRKPKKKTKQNKKIYI